MYQTLFQALYVKSFNYPKSPLIIFTYAIGPKSCRHDAGPGFESKE